MRLIKNSRPSESLGILSSGISSCASRCAGPDAQEEIADGKMDAPEEMKTRHEGIRDTHNTQPKTRSVRKKNRSPHR